MEVEARFAVPDRSTYERLRSLETLERFVVEAPETLQIDDVYLDTEDRRISHAGYACCLRREGNHQTVLLRKREIPDPPVHRYERLQADIPGDLPWSQWPAGPVRDELVALVGDADLRAVLALNRTQEKRRVRLEDRIVAELKQDVVRQTVADEQQEFLDLVIRLNEGGTEADLADLIESVRSRFNVLPQPVSRYQRGVAVDGRPPAEVPLLTRDEYRLLKTLAQAKQKYARRACALIALHHGATQAEAGAYAGLTDRRVRHWLAEFREKRLGIFPQAVLDAETGGDVALSTHSEADEAPTALRPPVVWATSTLSLPASSQDPGPGLDPDDTMTEAARKTLRFQFLAMLAQEEATRAGGDSEALHKMRVATRRMRAAARVYKSYVKKKAIKPYLRGLRRTAGVLGQVRDLDVAQEKAEAYLQSDAGNGADLDPILISWQAAHEEARAKLLTYLDSDPFTTFKTGFGEFLEQPFPKPRRLESKVVPQALRHIVPVEIYQRLATVRAYGPAVTNAEVTLADYHSLRIATKRLRYTLEFFEEILGADVRLAVQELKGLQDYLGDLQDAVVASDRLRNFWLWGTWDLPADGSFPARPVRSILAPGVARYHAAKQIEIQEALDGFPDFWQKFSGPSFSTLVAKAVSVL